MFIYLITNSVNGKRYVGKTKRSLQQRFRDHVYNATRRGSMHHIHSAMRKDGVENFVITLLQECFSFAEMRDAETWWVAELGTFGNDGYNETRGGDGSFGFRHSDETRRRMSESRNAFFDRGGESPTKGKKHTLESRERMSFAKRGKPGNHRMPHSEESKRKIRESVLAHLKTKNTQGE